MTDWRGDMRARLDAEIRVRRAIVRENQSRLAELEAIQAEFASTRRNASQNMPGGE